MKRLLALLLALLISLSLVSCNVEIPGGTNSSENPSENPGENPGASPEEKPSGDPSPAPGDTPSCDGQTTHVDTDNNGKCDTCDISVIVVIDFYAINDLHGKMSDTESQPGVDELTTYLKNANATDDYAIVLANGDMWQGTSESNLTRGKMMTEWLNAIGAVSMTIGNHDFDWSSEYISQNLAVADFPFLAINIYETATGARAPYATPSVTVSCGGAKIGIIGAIGDCYSSISPDKCTDVEFKVGSALSALVRAESERLRAEGCDFIVFAVHDGVSQSGTGTIPSRDMANYYDVALSSGYVDLVFESHTHQNYVLRDAAGVYHVQGGGDNSAISHVEIRLNYANDSSTVTAAETVRSYVYDDCESDAIIETLKDKYKDVIAKGSESLGYINRSYSGDALRQLSMDLYLAKGLALWGEEYEIAISGGYVGVRSPYNLYAGEVLYEDIYTLFPFDNALCLCTVLGRDLKSRFLYTDNSNYFISMSDYGKTLTIEDNKTYYIVMDTYSAYYAPNRVTVVELWEEEIYARDLIAEYIKDGGLGAVAPGNGGDTYPLTSIPEVIADVYALGANVESSSYYYVQGTIVDDPQGTYGNCTIRDEDGAEIYVFGLYGATGGRYDSLSNPPKKGDTVIVSAIAVLYQRAGSSDLLPELKNARIQKVL